MEEMKEKVNKADKELDEFSDLIRITQKRDIRIALEKDSESIVSFK